jgi:hypothetical protein
MAGEWLKLELNTADKPEVLKMARILSIDKDAVLGKLVRVWAWFDKNTVDGLVDGVVDEDLDNIAHQQGFCHAMSVVGWLEYDNSQQYIKLPKFDRHNGQTAKNRALKNERQARWRSGVDSKETVVETVSASTKASTREEKRRYINTSAFAEFYAAYPKKKNRGDAERAFKKLNPDPELLKKILSAIESAKRTPGWLKDDGQFIPYPATWLNARGWEDELTTKPAGKPWDGAK